MNQRRRVPGASLFAVSAAKAQTTRKMIQILPIAEEKSAVVSIFSTLPYARPVSFQIPRIIYFNYRYNLSGRKFTRSIGIGFLNQLDAPSEFVVIFKTAMSFSQDD
jgi:hypothetical protein